MVINYMKLNDWLYNKSTGIRLLFGKRNSGVDDLLKQVVNNIPSTKQIIILDINRKWQAKILPQRTHIIYSTGKLKLIEIISNLYSIISPRLSLVIIDGLPLFFRDFKGKGAKKIAINIRGYAGCLAMLKRISDLRINVIVTSYSQGINPDQPIMQDATLYYCTNIYRIRKNREGKLVLYSNKKEEFQIQ